MADFHIWGQIHHIAPQQFAVVVSSVPADLAEQAHKAEVRLQILPGLQEAQAIRSALMRAAGEAIRLRGDRVVDVLEE